MDDEDAGIQCRRNEHTERPDDSRHNGRRRCSKKEQAKRKKEQGKRKKEQVNENRRRERKKNALTGVESAEKREWEDEGRWKNARGVGSGE